MAARLVALSQLLDGDDDSGRVARRRIRLAIFGFVFGFVLTAAIS